MFFQCINFRQVPWEVLKTAAFGLGFQHLPRDVAKVNALKTMFDPYIKQAHVFKLSFRCLSEYTIILGASICIFHMFIFLNGRTILNIWLELALHKYT